MAFELAPDKVEAFWRQVEVRGPDDCWQWTGARFPAPTRTGLAIGPTKPLCAHRLAYYLTYGIPPTYVDGDGFERTLRLMHSCHGARNLLCCNPDHLELVTLEREVEVRASFGLPSFRGHEPRIVTF